MHHNKRMNLNFWPLIRARRSLGGLKEVLSGKQCHIWIPWPKKPIFQYASWQNNGFEILTSYQRSEVISWPQRGHISKTMSYLNFLTQKTYISIYIMAKRWHWIFDLWSEVRGHLVASDKLYRKNDVIFEFLDPKNLYFNIHHGKRMEFNFWPLIRGHLVTSERFE